MGPIQPGNKISRSSTTVQLEYQQTALGSQRRTSAKPQPNFMRPTSASRARRNSTMPSSDTAVHQDPRRPSGGQPPALRTTPFNGSRLSSSKSNRALRAHVKSGDLSFREIYGSEEAGEGDTQDIEMGRPEVFKAEHYRAGSIRASGNENTMGTLDAQHRRATTLTDPEFCLVLEKYPRGPGTRTPPEKSLPQLAPIPDVDHDESKRASEAPCLLAELQPARFPEYEPAEPHAELGIMSEDCQEHIRPKCMSGLISRREGSRGNIKEKSNMKSSDQRESMGAYEERCLYAPPHLGLEQRDTAMRGGADEDDLTDTSLIKPSYMHFKGPPPRPKSEGEEDDVRNVSPKFLCPFHRKFASLFPLFHFSPTPFLAQQFVVFLFQVKRLRPFPVGLLRQTLLLLERPRIRPRQPLPQRDPHIQPPRRLKTSHDGRRPPPAPYRAGISSVLQDARGQGVDGRVYDCVLEQPSS